MVIKNELDKRLKRWTDAALIDSTTAERIRVWEDERKRSSEWLVRVALALGGIMLGAGVLLFVAAHWDTMSPAGRFATVVLIVSAFHIGDAFTVERFRNLGITLHALGTVALGAGIFLAGQIFNLEEHWPGGVMMWALGAILAWALRGDSVQAIFSALLIPAWLAGEWTVWTVNHRGSDRILAEGLLVLAFAYFASARSAEENHWRKGLRLIGAIAIMPLTIWVVESYDASWRGRLGDLSALQTVTGIGVGFGLPILLGWILRRKEAWLVAAAACWVFVLGLLDVGGYADRNVFNEMAVYGWCIVCSILIVVWGMKETDKLKVNLGILGFGATVMAFYFSSVMDKLGRSVALMGFGIIFLIGGYELEKIRRKLMAKMQGGAE